MKYIVDSFQIKTYAALEATNVHVCGGVEKLKDNIYNVYN